MDLSVRVVSDAAICGGKPVIRGTRIMVRNILSMLKGGYDVQRVLDAHPELSREDVEAALDYAAELVDEVRLIPRAG
jgi:uncharacterized protein (DUF433 family)